MILRTAGNPRSRVAWAAVLALSLCTAAAAAEESPDAKRPGAEKLRWLTEHAVAVRPSAAAPADDFSDLMPLLPSIGSSRVVALGEATHGDGAALEAKVRLVRFLHEVMGFDVLAWESGFFDVHLMDAALRGDVPLQEVAGRGLYQIWSKSAEVRPVFAYLRSTQGTTHPLQSVGFDCRIAKDESRSKLFPAFVFEFFDRLDPSLISKQERVDLTVMSVGLVPKEVFDHPGERNYNRDLPRRLISTIDTRRADLLVRSSPREIDFVRQSLVSFLSMDHALGGRAGTGSDEEGYSRDTAMAENLLWLLQGPLAGRKVIVWAHNYHVMRDFTSATAAGTEAVKTHPAAGAMGLHLARALGRDFYAIGFLTHHGRFGYAEEGPQAQQDIPAADPASFEGLLHAVGKPQLFLPLRDLPPDHWLRSPISSGFYFHEPQTTNMPRIYDAVFFIDEMTPSHTVEPIKPL